MIRKKVKGGEKITLEFIRSVKSAKDLPEFFFIAFVEDTIELFRAKKGAVLKNCIKEIGEYLFDDGKVEVVVVKKEMDF